jgi:L-ascorbate metabolism protein UlaG (beta-lactamase superfamily)
MTNFVKKILLIITVVWISNFGFSQSNEIKIKFIGNCGLHITDGESNFYIDFPYKQRAYRWMSPSLLKYDKSRVFGTYNKSEIDSIKENAIFIFTHKHLDHYSKKILNKLDGKIYNTWNVSELEKLSDSISDFNIQAFKTKHKVFGASYKHYSYLITWHGKKIYISGDTNDFEHLSNIKDIDWAFVNFWSQKEHSKIDAKNFGIYHLDPIQKVIGEIPDNFLILINQGEIIKIPFIQHYYE